MFSQVSNSSTTQRVNSSDNLSSIAQEPRKTNAAVPAEVQKRFEAAQDRLAKAYSMPQGGPFGMVSMSRDNEIRNARNALLEMKQDFQGISSQADRGNVPPQVRQAYEGLQMRLADVNAMPVLDSSFEGPKNAARQSAKDRMAALEKEFPGLLNQRSDNLTAKNNPSGTKTDVTAGEAVANAAKIARVNDTKPAPALAGKPMNAATAEQAKSASGALGAYMHSNNIDTVDVNKLYDIANNGGGQVPEDVQKAADFMVKNPDVYKAIETKDVSRADGISARNNFDIAAQGKVAFNQPAATNTAGTAADTSKLSLAQQAKNASGTLAAYMRTDSLGAVDMNKLYAIANSSDGQTSKDVRNAAAFMLKNPDTYRKIETNDISGVDGISGLRNFENMAMGKIKFDVPAGSKTAGEQAAQKLKPPVIETASDNLKPQESEADLKARYELAMQRQTLTEQVATGNLRPQEFADRMNELESRVQEREDSLAMARGNLTPQEFAQRKNARELLANERQTLSRFMAEGTIPSGEFLARMTKLDQAAQKLNQPTTSNASDNLKPQELEAVFKGREQLAMQRQALTEQMASRNLRPQEFADRMNELELRAQELEESLAVARGNLTPQEFADRKNAREQLAQDRKQLSNALEARIITPEEFAARVKAYDQAAQKLNQSANVKSSGNLMPEVLEVGLKAREQLAEEQEILTIQLASGNIRLPEFVARMNELELRAQETKDSIAVAKGNLTPQDFADRKNARELLAGERKDLSMQMAQGTIKPEEFAARMKALGQATQQQKNPIDLVRGNLTPQELANRMNARELLLNERNQLSIELTRGNLRPLEFADRMNELELRAGQRDDSIALARGNLTQQEFADRKNARELVAQERKQLSIEMARGTIKAGEFAVRMKALEQAAQTQKISFDIPVAARKLTLEQEAKISAGALAAYARSNNVALMDPNMLYALTINANKRAPKEVQKAASFMLTNPGSFKRIETSQWAIVDGRASQSDLNRAAQGITKFA